MLRIIDGQLYEGKRSADRVRVTLRDLGHGHREVAVSVPTDWEHVGALHPDSIEAQIRSGLRERDPEDLEAIRRSHRMRSARRARQNVRHTCKAMGLDQLLTLTYQDNVLDRERVLRDFKAFVRRMRALVGDFHYVACIEGQKRGALHVHVAVRRIPLQLPARNGVKVKSFNVVRAIWRQVIKGGGNVHCGKKLAACTPARAAAYLAKYVGKDFLEGEEGSRRVLKSRCDIPPGQRLEFRGVPMAEVIGLVWTEFADEGGRVVDSVWCSQFGDAFFLSSEVPTLPGIARGQRSLQLRPGRAQ